MEHSTITYEEKREWREYHTQKQVCSECKHSLIININKNEVICTHCGLVQGSEEHKTGELYKDGGFQYDKKIH